VGKCAHVGLHCYHGQAALRLRVRRGHLQGEEGGARQRGRSRKGRCRFRKLQLRARECSPQPWLYTHVVAQPFQMLTARPLAAQHARSARQLTHLVHAVLLEATVQFGMLCHHCSGAEAQFGAHSPK
jgi:hypothetical protein